jgi:hypothetical protein
MARRTPKELADYFNERRPPKFRPRLDSGFVREIFLSPKEQSDRRPLV